MYSSASLFLTIACSRLRACMQLMNKDGLFFREVGSVCMYVCMEVIDVMHISLHNKKKVGMQASKGPENVRPLTRPRFMANNLNNAFQSDNLRLNWLLLSMKSCGSIMATMCFPALALVREISGMDSFMRHGDEKKNPKHQTDQVSRNLLPQSSPESSFIETCMTFAGSIYYHHASGIKARLASFHFLCIFN